MKDLLPLLLVGALVYESGRRGCFYGNRGCGCGRSSDWRDGYRGACRGCCTVSRRSCGCGSRWYW